MMKIKFRTAQRAVTTATTPEKLKETPEHQENKFIALTIRANTGNAGNVTVTMENQNASATFGYILAPGETMPIDVSTILDAYIDISEIWIDAANNGDGVSYYGFEVIM